MTPEQLGALFAYHPPSNDDIKHSHEEVREQCWLLAAFFNDLLPDSREKSIAITKVQEAMWAANAAIAIHMNGDT